MHAARSQGVAWSVHRPDWSSSSIEMAMGSIIDDVGGMMGGFLNRRK